MAEQKLLVFELGKEEYALPVLQTREIIKYQGTTRLPNSNSTMEGVINLRGRIVPIFDLAKRFALQQKNESDRDSQVIIIEHNNQQLGIMVNSVTEVLQIEENQIEPPPVQEQHRYLKGVGKTDNRMLLLLDLNELLGVHFIDALGPKN